MIYVSECEREHININFDDVKQNYEYSIYINR